jgi:hypothetical protein
VLLDEIGKGLKEEKEKGLVEEKEMEKKKQTVWFWFPCKFVDCHITDEFMQIVPHQPYSRRFIG